MGRTLQVTILFGFIAASWVLISNPTKSYFGISMSLFPLVYFGLIIMLILAVVALITLALSEIPTLNQNHKKKLLSFYDSLYSYGILYMIASILLQIWFWGSNLLSDFLAKKITKDVWMLIIFILTLGIVGYLNKKYKFFKKIKITQKNNEK